MRLVKLYCMDSNDFLYKLLNNVFFGILCSVIGVFRLRYRLRKGIKVPKNRIIQPDLDSFFVSILLIMYGFVVIIVKIVK